MQEEGKQGTDEKDIRLRVGDQRHEFMREIRDRGTGQQGQAIWLGVVGEAPRCLQHSRVLGKQPRRGSELTPDFGPWKEGGGGNVGV